MNLDRGGPAGDRFLDGLRAGAATAEQSVVDRGLFHALEQESKGAGSTAANIERPAADQGRRPAGQGMLGLLG